MFDSDIIKLMTIIVSSILSAGGGFWGAKKITARSLARKIKVLQTLIINHKRDLNILRSKMERNKRDDQFFRDEYDRFLDTLNERVRKVETYLEILLKNAMNDKK